MTPRNARFFRNQPGLVLRKADRSVVNDWLGNSKAELGTDLAEFFDSFRPIFAKQARKCAIRQQLAGCLTIRTVVRTAEIGGAAVRNRKGDA
jgi:hypothetical protein